MNDKLSKKDKKNYITNNKREPKKSSKKIKTTTKKTKTSNKNKKENNKKIKVEDKESKVTLKKKKENNKKIKVEDKKSKVTLKNKKENNKKTKVEDKNNEVIFKEKSKIKISLIMIGFLFIFIIIFGFSYAIFNGNIIGANKGLIAGELYLKYVSGEVINMNGILPTDTYSEDNYFEFNIKGKNTSNKDVFYQIILEHGNDIDGKIRLADKFLKFRLVEVVDNREVEIFNDKGFPSIDNRAIHADQVLANTNSEIEKTYRLYVWVNGVLIGNTASSDYSSEEWTKIYSNIKVLVKSDGDLEGYTYTVNFNHPLPAEYQEVEYIENTGEQFIDTKVSPTNDLTTDIVYMDTSAIGINSVLGSRNGNTLDSEIIYAINGDNETSSIEVVMMNQTTNSDTSNQEILVSPRVKNTKYHILIYPEYNSDYGYRLNANLENLTNKSTSKGYTSYKELGINATYPNIGVFGDNSSFIHNGMRLYSLKFYKSGNLIRNFIPCYRKRDGIIGLYDMVEQEFYINAGGGDFLKGKDIGNGYHEAGTQEFTYGVEENLITNTYSSEYTFMEWNTKVDGSGTIYLDSENVKNLSSVDKDIVNLYAILEKPKSYAGYYVYDMVKDKAVIDSVSSKYVANTTGIDFYKKSGKNNGRGVYLLASTKDDTYPTYYYRGDVVNNNVIFDGFCWKIIRTTDTGGTKLIYNGKPVDGKCDNKGLDTFSSSGVYFATTTSTTVGLASAGYSYTEEKILVTNTKTSANMGKAPGTIFASDVEYIEITDETTGQKSWKYRLIGEKVTSTGTNATTFNAEREALLKEHHYTCFSAISDVCSTVYFVYMVRDNNNYYASLSNGLFLNDFLNIEFNGNSTNEKKSTIHDNVNNWYINNLLDVNHYIEDTIYCNDRTLYQPWTNTSSVSNNVDEKTHFGAKARVAYTGGVTVSCPTVADSFTVSKAKGNGILENPIGLITLDEVVLAGYAWGWSSTDNYLYTGESDKVWWTMSPGFISATGVYPAVIYSTLDTVAVNYRGKRDANKIWSGGGVRPVISLKNNTIIGSGLGTKEEPFILQ